LGSGHEPRETHRHEGRRARPPVQVKLAVARAEAVERDRDHGAERLASARSPTAIWSTAAITAKNLRGQHLSIKSL
jgi:hypothetical protein